MIAGLSMSLTYFSALNAWSTYTCTGGGSSVLGGQILKGCKPGGIFFLPVTQREESHLQHAHLMKRPN